MSEEEYLKQKEREARRRQRIKRFAERQHTACQWIALDEIADWCARSVTGASAAADEEARTLAYERLDQSARNGEFEASCQGQTQSRIMYLHPRMTQNGKHRRWLTREQLYWVASMRDIAAYCWLPRELAQRWLMAHGYPWPPHFDPVVAKSSAAGEPGSKHAPAPSSVEAVITAEIQRLGHWIFLQYPKILGFKKLYELARNTDQVGTFRKADFLSAFQAVYETKGWRRPKTGWRLRSPYKERTEELKPSRKS